MLITVEIEGAESNLNRERTMQNDQNQLNTQSAADIELVQFAKQGDSSAFEELVRRYTKRVFAIANHITRSREDAEEVSQETFLKACRHLKDFEGKAQFGAWLTRIAVSTALTKVSRSKFVQIEPNEESDSELSSTANDVPDWRPNPEELYSQHQLGQRLAQALEQLPRLYSTVFLLRDVQGLSVRVRFLSLLRLAFLPTMGNKTASPATVGVAEIAAGCENPLGS